VLSRLFLNRTPEVTNEAIIRSVNRALPQIERVLSRKSFFVGVASLMIVTALGLIGGRLIYSIEQAPYHPSKNLKAPTSVRPTR
jgi:hypothetical protein